jgi:hypothetical protein
MSSGFSGLRVTAPIGVQFQVALLPQVNIDTTRGRGKGKIGAETTASQIFNGIAKGRAEIDMGAMVLLLRILRLSLALRERIIIGR